ncbi:hypothetical protein C8F01DRAFT_1251736 [Mycena amicta]|nr:hypothetical protein C8F01DRAFT_1251736 [Mycena amicta]
MTVPDKMQQLQTSSVTGLLASNTHLTPGGPYRYASASACTSATRVDVTSEDDPTDVQLAESGEPEPPRTTLTFLLASGSRCTRCYDPQTTGKTVKDSLWTEWPSDWPDTRPPTSSYLRVLHLGRVLRDEETLSKHGFPSHTHPPSEEASSAPTIVHLAISAAPRGTSDAVCGCQCIIC